MTAAKLLFTLGLCHEIKAISMPTANLRGEKSQCYSYFVTFVLTGVRAFIILNPFDTVGFDTPSATQPKSPTQGKPSLSSVQRFRTQIIASMMHSQFGMLVVLFENFNIVFQSLYQLSLTFSLISLAHPQQPRDTQSLRSSNIFAAIQTVLGFEKCRQ